MLTPISVRSCGRWRSPSWTESTPRCGPRPLRRPVPTAPGKCQQVWCPVCALAALVSGEQHPLLTVIAEHSVALLSVVRAMVADIESTRGPAAPPPDEPPPSGPSRYQHIPVTVEE